MKHLLVQYADLLEEKKEIQKRIRKIEQKIELMLKDGNVKDAVKGGEGGLQTFHIEGFPHADYDEAEYLLTKARRELRQREIKITEQTVEVEHFLNTLDDSRMRRMITKRFIEGKSWNQVANEMGKLYTAESCQKQTERFLKKL